MDEQKICPICGTEVPAGADTCPVCGMDDLNRIFLDKESYERWVETKLKLCTGRYNEAMAAVAAGGSQENVFPLKYDPYSRIRPVIAASGGHTVRLKEEGTVIAVGYNLWGECNVSNWRNIVAIAAGTFHTVGLKKDGTVIILGHDIVFYEYTTIGHYFKIIAIQGICKEYQQQKTNQRSPMDGSARKPQQFLAEAGVIT